MIWRVTCSNSPCCRNCSNASWEMLPVCITIAHVCVCVCVCSEKQSIMCPMKVILTVCAVLTSLRRLQRYPRLQGRQMVCPFQELRRSHSIIRFDGRYLWSSQRRLSRNTSLSFVNCSTSSMYASIHCPCSLVIIPTTSNTCLLV